MVANLNPRDPEVQGLQAKSENAPLEMSFAFKCNNDRFNEDFTRREVLEASLHKGDISICCFGANPETSLTIDQRGGHSLEERRAFAERISEWGGRRPGFAAEYASAPASRGRSQVAVPRKPPATRRSHVQLARARRAKGESNKTSRSRQPVAGRSTGLGHVEIAKARRAKLPG